MKIKTMNLAKLPILIIVAIEIFHFGAGIPNGDKRCSCYEFFNVQSLSWIQARDTCKFNNNHLVVMETKREWEFINEQIQTRKSGKFNEWHIGLYKNLTIGNWTWVNGKALTIDKWQEDNPEAGDVYALMAKEFPKGFKGSFSSMRDTNTYTGWICEDETDNCQGVCLVHNPVPTNSTPPGTTTPTTKRQRNISTVYGSTSASGIPDGDKRCSCYTFINDLSVSWIQARDSCKFKNKHLVVMETEREWEFINKEIQTRKSGKCNEWHIGLYRNLTTGNWSWIKGKPLTVDKWQDGEPRDSDFYALMAKEWPPGFNGTFNSIRGNVNRGWICEEETDNCQGVCLLHNPVQTDTTSPMTIASTTQRTVSPTHGNNVSSDPSATAKAPEGGEQTYDKDNSSSVVIILASLVAVLSAALLIIFAAYFLSWRKKKRKDTRNATDTRNQLDDQDGSSLSPENFARQLGFSEEAEPRTIEHENQRRETEQSSRQECGYAMLTPRTMTVPGDSSYASLVNSKQEDCINESSVAASPLLQHDEEPHDGQPTYVNVRSSEYMNI